MLLFRNLRSAAQSRTTGQHHLQKLSYVNVSTLVRAAIQRRDGVRDCLRFQKKGSHIPSSVVASLPVMSQGLASVPVPPMEIEKSRLKP